MPHVTAEVISIGDEMTSGARLDTNAQWLSRRIGELGIEVTFHSTVGDSLQDNVEVFRIASERADVIVCTGGLGPTRDDLTREALAQLVGQPLELNEQSLQHIESMFARRQREMPVRNRNQAMFPRTAQEIFNPQGTAPGVDLTVPRVQPAHGQRPSARVFALPGVPAEMKSMFDETVAKRIMEMAGKAQVIRHSVMRFFGTGESDMEQLLGDMIARDRRPRVGITVSSATISLRITATGVDELECEQLIDGARKEIMQRAGQYYFGDGEGFEQHDAVESSMRQFEQSLLVIELGYAAPLGDWFAQLGETPAYRGGLSLASLDDLCRLTGESEWKTSLNVLMGRFEATHVVLVDGYPILDQQTDRPVPAADVDIHVATSSGSLETTTVTLGGHPSIVQARIGKAALAWLRRCLKSRVH